ncbi:hypothetical protein EFP95_01015 [Lentilactobacillus hilgardii]|nr:hypothetical protein [Lentilactobacillus hilgardii]
MPVSVFIKQLVSSSNNAKYANQLVQTVAIKGDSWPLKNRSEYKNRDVTKTNCAISVLLNLPIVIFDQVHVELFVLQH